MPVFLRALCSNSWHGAFCTEPFIHESCSLSPLVEIDGLQTHTATILHCLFIRFVLLTYLLSRWSHITQVRNITSVLMAYCCVKWIWCKCSTSRSLWKVFQCGLAISSGIILAVVLAMVKISTESTMMGILTICSNSFLNSMICFTPLLFCCDALTVLWLLLHQPQWS